MSNAQYELNERWLGGGRPKMTSDCRLFLKSRERHVFSRPSAPCPGRPLTNTSPLSQALGPGSRQARSWRQGRGASLATTTSIKLRFRKCTGNFSTNRNSSLPFPFTDFKHSSLFRECDSHISQGLGRGYVHQAASQIREIISCFRG